MKKLISLLIILTLAIPNAEAQFLTKLKKKIEEKVENAVTENVSDKAASETDKSLNKMWEQSLSKSSLPFGAERVDPALIPDTYDFSWEYKMKMDTPDGAMEMVYLLREDAPYVGIKIPQAENMLTVMDKTNEMTVIFMNSGEQNMVMASKITFSTPEDEEMDNSYMNMEIEEIGSKEILGYKCQGYKTENEDHIFTFYITGEAGISFSDLFQTNQKNIPEGFDAKWLKDGEGLLMEMQMKDKNNPKRDATMTCTGIEKKPFTIKKSDYKAL